MNEEILNQIFSHSCESMTEIQDGRIALTVTSPPYWNAIDYDIHSQDKTRYYRTRNYTNGYSDYKEYIGWLSRVFAEVLRVTKPGGFCAIVVGTVLLEGKHFPVPFDTVRALCENGWEFHQDIIWHKCTAGVKRAGSAIQKPYPGYYYPNIMTEYILIFKKAGPAIYQNKSQHNKAQSPYPINRLFTMDIANNIWHIAPVPPGIIDHPCPFPEEIPYRLIQLYSYPDDVVFDPFAGSGQTLKIAHHLNRRWIGYETIEKYVKLSLQRINEPLSLREMQLVAKFDKIQIDEPTGDKTANKPIIKSRQKKMFVNEIKELFDGKNI
ncbi:MAG: site-specific DNA-methyltransferase [Calditrichaeota bacterium]|nr:site-specific DNA-methyltransferase [Calditrichota bacterium]